MTNWVFGRRSSEQLLTCCIPLRTVMHRALALSPMDFSVLEGHRILVRQQQLFREGKSQKDGVTDLSHHQSSPSEAVDIAPYPISWGHPKRFVFLAGVVMAAASDVGVELRWGGNWDGDTWLHDQSFFDLGHFELEK